MFLAPNEMAPATEESKVDLSQEELLEEPVHIENRPKKDPRDLRVLDPACGSGHFLLYAFDLLIRIYEEAWEDPENPKSEATGAVLREEFETLDELRRAVPKLIIEHNLHGIDIDHRAMQIAVLALWLRAQRAWKKLGIKADGRLRIDRSNIVTAEPMPGEEDMRREFTAGLKPRVLGQLVDVVFDKMKLAGEAGSLLKIEEEIKDDIADARKQWLEGPKPDQQLLFPGIAVSRPRQQELRFDLKGVTGEQFWEQAEDRILEALKEYAERAENGHPIRRRLFAEDAACGFAFIDLCRKRYDVVLMNPPFGDPPLGAKEYIFEHYLVEKTEQYGCFISRSCQVTREDGFVGALSSRTGYFLTTLSMWRKRQLLADDGSRCQLFVDLGSGVLDAAAVECAAITVTKSSDSLIALRLYDSEDVDDELVSSITDLQGGFVSARVFLCPHRQLRALPDSPFAYFLPKGLRQIFENLPRLSQVGVVAKQGIATSDNFRFLRLRWEIPPENYGVNERWITYAKGGTYSPFYTDFELVLNWKNEGHEVKEFSAGLFGTWSKQITNTHLFARRGLTYPRRTHNELGPAALPEGCGFDVQGSGLFHEHGCSMEERRALNAVTASRVFNALLRVGLARTSGDLAKTYPESLIMSMPVPLAFSDSSLAEQTERAQRLRQSLSSVDENTIGFSLPIASFAVANTISDLAVAFEMWRESLLDHLRSEVIEMDGTIFRLYGLDKDEETKSFIESELGSLDENSHGWKICSSEVYAAGLKDISNGLARSFISFFIGIVLGRWDVRIAMDATLAPKLADSFDPLPVCPPGMLVGSDGLPPASGRIVSEEWLSARPDANTLPPEGVINAPTIPDDGYPFRVSWDGILVDDPGFNGGSPHRDDIVRRIREVLELIWKDKAHEIEQEASEILGVRDLRDYLRKPSGFFQDHLKRYSKSRRKAPIYWPLSTASGSFTVWLYYHRLTDQTLYATVNNYVEPKIAEVERSIDRVEEEIKSASGGDATRLRDRLSEGRTFLGELHNFRGELLRIAALPYKPDLNDGVIINAAPFHGLFQLRSWAKDTETVWKKLEKGDYDWANLAYTLWPKRVRETCKEDHSIAIAHGLEDLCEAAPPTGKGKKGRRNAE